MRVKNIHLKEDSNSITLSADCKIRPVGWDTLYFKFNKKYKDDLVCDGSPFAAALLIPSMFRNEDLIIDGSVSKELYDGMHRIMDMMAGWDWEIKLHRIKIQAQEIKQDTGNPKKVATFFSGGVDSFYTYLKHQHDEKDRITHFILMNGNDIDLDNESLWKATKKTVEKIAEKAGVEVVEVESNFQYLIEPILDAGFTHGGLLAGVGLCLRNGFKKIYIAATFSSAQNVKWGSSPEIDKNWNTEQISFEHDGAEATRLDKVEWQIAKSPLALEYLRVCYMNLKGEYNCGECEKCIRTMIELRIAGKLNEAKTFPHTFDYQLVTEAVAGSGFGAEVTYKHHLADLQRKKVDPELQKAIERGLQNVVDIHDNGKERILKNIILIDHLYFRRIFRKMWWKISRSL